MAGSAARCGRRARQASASLASRGGSRLIDPLKFEHSAQRARVPGDPSAARNPSRRRGYHTPRGPWLRRSEALHVSRRTRLVGCDPLPPAHPSDGRQPDDAGEQVGSGQRPRQDAPRRIDHGKEHQHSGRGAQAPKRHEGGLVHRDQSHGPRAAGVVKLYARRFTIEETFRDIKDNHFGMGRDPHRYAGASRPNASPQRRGAGPTLLGAAGEACGLDRTLMGG